jgi:hypothetical protein
VASEAAREHARRLDGRRLAQVVEEEPRLDREAPLPAGARRVVLGMGDDHDDCEDHLPAGGVADRSVAELDGRAARRRVRAQLVPRDLVREPAVAPATDEEPVSRYSRSTTPASAWPKPMHMLAIP